MKLETKPRRVRAEIPDLLTEVEATQYLGFKNPGSLRNMRSKSQGPKYFKIGRYVRYKIEHLDMWIDRQIVDPEAA